jgi:hypothetical protein
MTSLPEQTPKKTPVLSIVALLSNGCKQALPLLTVDLQRARHSILCVKLTTRFHLVLKLRMCGALSLRHYIPVLSYRGSLIPGPFNDTTIMPIMRLLKTCIAYA